MELIFHNTNEYSTGCVNRMDGPIVGLKKQTNISVLLGLISPSCAVRQIYIYIYEQMINLLLPEIVTSSTDPVRTFAGEEVILSCVATAANTVDIKWRKKADNWAEDNRIYVPLTAEQDDYEPSSGTRKSTLTIGSAATTDTSDSIECYDETIEISEVMTLEVIGENISLFKVNE